jgi:polar amino acid transport system substrate-binding protein
MKKLFKLFIFLIPFVLFSLTVALSGEVVDRILERGYVTVGTSADQLPLSMRSKDGEIIGLDADVALLIASSMGVKVGFEVMPFDELIPALKEGKIDMIISGMTITPERNLEVAFVGPYFITGKGLLTTTANMTTFKDLASINKPNVRVVALRGSTSQQFVNQWLPDAEYMSFRSLDSAVNALLLGDADVLIADSHYCAVTAFRYKDRGVVAGSARFTFEPLGIALPTNDPLLVNWVDNFLITLRGSGDLKIFTERWFNDPSWLEEIQ